MRSTRCLTTSTPERRICVQSSASQRRIRDLPSVTMPTISRFYGVVIRMFHNEQAPPHFHAEYAGSVAAISIEDLEVIAQEHCRGELWSSCLIGQPCTN